MASQSQGIHQLLQAEKRAKDKLEEAKKSKCPVRASCQGVVTKRGRGRTELCGRNPVQTLSPGTLSRSQ